MTKADLAVGRAFAALGDPQRRKTIELLRKGPQRAGDLAGALGLSPPAMSRHLRALKESGLVEEAHPEFDARVRIYALKRDGLDALKTWVNETDALWTRQLAAFKAYAEKPR